MSEVDLITETPHAAVTPIGQAPIEDEPQSEPRATDKIVSFAREHPVLLVAGGLALGALAAAVFRGRSGKPAGTGSFARRAVSLAAAAGEIGLSLSRQAREGAEHVAREGRERISQDSDVVLQRASRIAQEARDTGQRLASEARDTGQRLASEARRIVSRQSH